MIAVLVPMNPVYGDGLSQVSFEYVLILSCVSYTPISSVKGLSRVNLACWDRNVVLAVAGSKTPL